MAKIPKDVLIIVILMASCLASFCLGYLAGRETGQGSEVTFTTSPSGSTGEVVASRTGTKYYLPTCDGVAKIAADNKVWFASAALARNEGYEPAVNCDGL